MRSLRLSVEQQVHLQLRVGATGFLQMHAEYPRLRMVPLVRLERLAFTTEPTDVVATIALMITHVPGIGERSISLAHLRNSLHQSLQVGIGPRPIEPTQGAVLTIGVVVAALGMPKFAAGSELGHTQRGNNNAYCQDGPLSWLDWAGADADLQRLVQRVAQVRERYRPFANAWYVGDHQGDGGYDIGWFGREGEALETHQWHHPQSRVLGVHLQKTGSANSQLQVYLLLNAEAEAAHAVLPHGAWRVVLDTSRADGAPESSGFEPVAAAQPLRISVAAESLLMLVQGEDS